MTLEMEMPTGVAQHSHVFYGWPFRWPFEMSRYFNHSTASYLLWAALDVLVWVLIICLPIWAIRYLVKDTAHTPAAVLKVSSVAGALTATGVLASFYFLAPAGGQGFLSREAAIFFPAMYAGASSVAVLVSLLIVRVFRKSWGKPVLGLLGFFAGVLGGSAGMFGLSVVLAKH